MGQVGRSFASSPDVDDDDSCEVLRDDGGISVSVGKFPLRQSVPDIAEPSPFAR
jgi:hypothetical protein